MPLHQHPIPKPPWTPGPSPRTMTSLEQSVRSTPFATHVHVHIQPQSGGPCTPNGRHQAAPLQPISPSLSSKLATNPNGIGIAERDRDYFVIDTPLPLCHRVCRLVCTSNATVTHSYIAPASSAFTAHSGATLIKGNRRNTRGSVAWPAACEQAPLSGVAVRASPLVRLSPCPYTTAAAICIRMADRELF